MKRIDDRNFDNLNDNNHFRVEQISDWTKTTTFGLYFPSFFFFLLLLFVVMLEHGVSIKKWRRHLSIVDTGNCEASFRSGCQPLFVLAGCHY